MTPTPDYFAASNELFLRRFVALWMALLAITIVFAYVIGDMERPYTMFVMLVIGIAAQALIHLERYHAARLLIVGALCAGTMAMPFVISGIKSPIIGSWLISLLLAAWLLGLRQMIVVLFLAIASITAVWQLEATGTIGANFVVRPL